jgi:hypothetical protein
MGLYYRIWVDFIVKLNSRDVNKNNWQLTSIIAMSIAMTFNLVLFMAILQRHVLGHYFYKLNLPLFSSLENSIFSIFILFLLPCTVINYLLIFRGKRYEMLLKKYSYNNGKLFVTYFSISLFLPIILMWIGIFLYQ